MKAVLWAEQQRKLYAKGKLSKSKIKKLESLEGWTWDEKKGLEQDKQIYFAAERKELGETLKAMNEEDDS